MMLRWLSAAGLGSLLLLIVACESKPGKTIEASPANYEPAGPPLFQDITAGSGVHFTYRNGEDTARHMAILESLGGGVALLDYDGDGLLDVFLPGGGVYAGADSKDIVGCPCKLYKNLGNGQFKDVTAAVGLDKLADGQPWFYSHGCAVGDYDRDGWPDLLVTGWGRLALLHNVPVDPTDPIKGRRFEDVTVAAGLDKGITWATSAAFGDLDGDGYPDLYVCQYVNWSFANHPKCSYDAQTPDVCPPNNFDGLLHKVYLNTPLTLPSPLEGGEGRVGPTLPSPSSEGGEGRVRGTRKFVDVSTEAGLVPGGRDSSKGLGVLLIDVDGDGKPDVYVANDTVSKLLYLNGSTPGKIRFKEVGMSSGSARDGQGNANGSMGLDAGDYDGSGRPSLWVTNYEHELHGLYRNDLRRGSVLFHYQTAEAGLAESGQKYVGWGTAFLDVDLDGWEDLFVTNGHVVHFHPGKAVGRKQPPVMYRNLGGKFADISRQVGSYHEQNHLGRGVGFGDLDNDGRTDLVISHINEPVTILRGIGGQDHHWLGVQLVGKDHADVVGARVELQVGQRTLTRFAKGGGSYLSAGDRRLVFGMAMQTQPGTLTVTWPDSTQQRFVGLAGDHYYRIVQGQAQAELCSVAGVAKLPGVPH
jgi:hypothetical protein